MSNPDFYSQVARKFGGYQSNVQRTVTYQGAHPEQVFDTLVTSRGGSTHCLLDVGCADGRNVLRLAPAFQVVHAIDLSPEMLAAARQNQQTAGVTNIEFDYQDAAHTRFADATFDVVSSRRGPTFLSEYWRVLKPQGHFIYVGIGERDALALKQVFGRGQFYGEWDVPFTQVEQRHMSEAGFVTLSAEEFWFDEYYHSRADLSCFLEAVPIFEDYNPVQDAAKLDQYIEQAQTAQGIHLSRHRIVLLAQKPAD
jgi:ubiquinone/menaquinone biosynthesis C-methylase UbiE